ncbi:MAG TPA: aspartate aminotransferase family protein [Nitrososphaerales archaeon]|nr:aspartate aminotransferase family protein [Nitrososphaerales archaeon]
MTSRYQETEDAYGSSAFQKFPVTIVRGMGASVWDEYGKEFIDCMAGYGVAIVGHCNQDVVAALKTQAEKLITCHGSFYNDARAEFLERMAGVAPKGLEKSLLTNSGAETIEAAIKLARRHTGRKKVVSMKGGFHGKTFGALSATWNKKYRDPFGPLLPDFEFAEYGVAESASSVTDGSTAAVIAEPIQGETGIVVPPPDYLRSLRELCDRTGALLILDEIQTGLGRTGRMWASDHSGVVPDIMCVSKGLAGGVPFGAALTTREVMASLKRGEHTSTFAGNPLACAAASATLRFISEHDLPRQAAEKGRTMKSGLEKIASGSKLCREVRGMGLMLAVETRVDIHEALLSALKRGVIFAYSGRETFRFLPPLVIEESQISKALGVLGGVLVDEETRRLGAN